MKRGGMIALGALLALAAGGIWRWLHRDPLRDLPLPPLLPSPEVQRQAYRLQVERLRERWAQREVASPQDCLALGREYAALGHLGAAFFFLRRAVEMEPESLEGWQEFGRLALRLGRWKEAEEAAGHLLHRAPHQPQGYLLLADLNAAKENRPALRPILERAFQAVVPSHRLTIAFEQAQRGDFDGALRSFRALLREEPSNPTALLGLASLYIGVGRFPEAQRILTQVFRLAPPTPQGHVLWGQVEEWQHRPQEALRHFEQAVQLNPDDLMAWEHLAKVALQEGLLREAAIAYLSLLLRQPDHREARYGLAQVYQRLHRSALAKEQLRLYQLLRSRHLRLQSLRSAVEHPKARPQDYLALSEFHHALGEEKEALEVLSQAAARFPHDASLREARRRFFQEVDWLEALEGEERWFEAFLDGVGNGL